MIILETKNLTKRYRRLTAVDGLDLTIESGQVFGVLGPNGSGKTTLLGMILDVLQPTSGSYRWFGGENPVESRKKIGSILETPAFYPYLTAVQNLKVTAHIKECPFSRIDEVLEVVNLYDRRNDRFKTYSLGMKQRLAIAAALLADPPVLILDEPTNGLDPQGIAEVRTIVQQIAEKGKTIIMASHLLDEVQKVCSHFCILRKGKKLYQGEVNAITNNQTGVQIASEDLVQLKSVVDNFPGLQSVKSSNHQTITVALQDGYTSASLNQYLFEKQVTLTQLTPQKNSLEQEFLKILKEHD